MLNFWAISLVFSHTYMRAQPDLLWEMLSEHCSPTSTELGAFVWSSTLALLIYCCWRFLVTHLLSHIFQCTRCRTDVCLSIVPMLQAYLGSENHTPTWRLEKWTSYLSLICHLVLHTPPPIPGSFRNWNSSWQEWAMQTRIPFPKVSHKK